MLTDTLSWLYGNSSARVLGVEHSSHKDVAVSVIFRALFVQGQWELCKHHHPA